MIRILVNSGKLTEMKQVFNQMKQDSCQCHGSVFATGITAYADAGLLDEAISLYKSLSEFNCVNYTEPFVTLLQIMLKKSDHLQTCHRLFLENFQGWEVKSRIRSLNLLIDALCGMNRSELALDIFQEMSSNLWCYPGRETYKILMNGLCRDKRFTDATNLLLFMISNKGCRADVSIYRTFLESLCDNGEVDEALNLLGTILRKGFKAPKRYWKQLDSTQLQIRKEGSIQHTKASINEALIRGSFPCKHSYTSMIVDLYTEGRIAEGDHLIKQMQQKGFRSSSPIYEAKIAALFRSGEIDEAMAVVETEMVENNCIPTLKLHNTVLKGLHDAGEFTRALLHFRRMSKQVGCVPDKETYKCIVNALCCNGNSMEASRMLEKMVMESLWPEDETYTKVIHCLCLIKKPYIAAMWLEEMISEAKIPSSSVWTCLVSCFCAKTSSKNQILLLQILTE
ncbi:hypothetical protein M569_04630, partial [Genlisea aurea]